MKVYFWFCLKMGEKHASVEENDPVMKGGLLECILREGRDGF